MEEWRTLENYPNYKISSMGRVMKDEILKQPFKDNLGYSALSMSSLTGKTCNRIHRLVAQAFIENAENKTQVDHINRDRTDNRIENLRWTTHKENASNCNVGINNTSGYKNISYYEPRKEWRVSIFRNGKTIFRKEFKDLDDALLNRAEILSRL